IGDFTALGRVSYYGAYENSNGSPITDIQEFGKEFMVDLELSYTFMDHYKLAIGARNILDNYPDPGDSALGESCCGRIYRSDSIVDWQGGYYYGRVEVSF
ncbi:MAG: TonB-dependent receptor, partial [Oricola sp.]|nr:TonB-dependent receptor [Oricola sp.]